MAWEVLYAIIIVGFFALAYKVTGNFLYRVLFSWIEEPCLLNLESWNLLKKSFWAVTFYLTTTATFSFLGGVISMHLQGGLPDNLHAHIYGWAIIGALAAVSIRISFILGNDRTKSVFFCFILGAVTIVFFFFAPTGPMEFTIAETVFKPLFTTLTTATVKNSYLVVIFVVVLVSAGMTEYAIKILPKPKVTRVTGSGS